jgi:hypothetical protein
MSGRTRIADVLDKPTEGISQLSNSAAWHDCLPCRRPAALSQPHTHLSGGAPGFHALVTPPPSWRNAWE